MIREIFDFYRNIVYNIPIIFFLRKDFSVKHIKALIYAVIFIVASILFLPLPGTTEIRNVPLLIVFHIFIFTRLTIKIVKRAKLFGFIRSALKENGFELEKVTPRNIIAKKDGVVCNVKPVIRKSAHMDVLTKKFKWEVNAKKIIVMDKLPENIGNGENLAVYDSKGFLNFLKSN